MDDPVKCCILYKDFGCSHVDGYLCNVDDCLMRLEYTELVDTYNLLDDDL